MNGKFIILFALCCNIIALAVSWSCYSNELGCGEQYNVEFLAKFLSVSATDTLDGFAGLALNQEFTNATEEMIKPQSSGVSVTSVIGVFLDPVLMIISMLAFLTPLPFVAFIFSLGMPALLSIIFIAPISVLWILSIFEFVRNASL